jgi:hypothetical protein
VRCVRPALLAALAACSPPAAALEVETLEVRVAGDGYRVRFEALLAAPAERVGRVLTDYAGYASLDPRIRESKVIRTLDTGEVLLQTRIRACAMIFCRTVRRTEQVTHREGRLVAVVVPAASDLEHGSSRTEWRGEAAVTHILYEAEFEPAFWVPGIVVRRYAAGALRESVVQLFANVEERARER